MVLLSQLYLKYCSFVGRVPLEGMKELMYYLLSIVVRLSQFWILVQSKFLMIAIVGA